MEMTKFPIVVSAADHTVNIVAILQYNMPLGLRFDDALAPASGGAGRYSTDAAGFAVSGLELDMIRQHSCTQQQSG